MYIFQSSTFTVPPAVVLTVEAYRAFANLPAVKKAIQKLLRSTHDVKNTVEDELSSLKAASESCIVALTQVALPPSLEKQVHKYVCLR